MHHFIKSQCQQIKKKRIFSTDKNLHPNQTKLKENQRWEENQKGREAH